MEVYSKDFIPLGLFSARLLNFDVKEAVMSKSCEKCLCLLFRFSNGIRTFIYKKGSKDKKKNPNKPKAGCFEKEL